MAVDHIHPVGMSRRRAGRGLVKQVAGWGIYERVFGRFQTGQSLKRIDARGRGPAANGQMGRCLGSGHDFQAITHLAVRGRIPKADAEQRQRRLAFKRAVHRSLCRNQTFFPVPAHPG